MLIFAQHLSVVTEWLFYIYVQSSSSTTLTGMTIFIALQNKTLMRWFLNKISLNAFD